MDLRAGLSDSKVTAIVGISKNAGKTSLLNYIIAQNPRRRYGVLSTGIDGEDFDLVFRHPKPKLNLNAGSFFVSDKEGLDTVGGCGEIVCTAPGSQPNRKIWIAKAVTDVQTRITGPSSVTMQIRAVDMLQDLGVEQVLIDGALDRKSIVTSDRVDAVCLVAGAAYGALDQIETELARIKILAGMSPFDGLSLSDYQRLTQSNTIMFRHDGQWEDTGLHSLIGSVNKLGEMIARVDPGSTLFVPGAVTEAMLPNLEAILRRGSSTLLLRHPDNLKASYEKLCSFVDRADIKTLIPFKIQLVAINSWAPGINQADADEFRERVKSIFDGVITIDIMDDK